MMLLEEMATLDDSVSLDKTMLVDELLTALCDSVGAIELTCFVVDEGMC
jgi:hypothetical protein